MKTEELRIGNYIISERSYFDKPTLGQIYTIAEGVAWFKYTEDNGEPGSISNPYHAIKPIPLSEEWLLKFGFKKSENGLLFEHPTPAKPEDEHKDLGTCFPSFFFNTRPEVKKWMDCHTRVTVEFVHSLQNLYFALTGEELTIKESGLAIEAKD